MKYFIDTEFLEGPQQEKFPISLFRKQTPNTIDLISIGIVAEDGREYYEISKDFNLDEAWNRYDSKEQKGSYGWKDGIIDGEVIWFAHEDGKYTMSVKDYWIRENVLKPIWIDLFLRYESEHTFLKGKSYDYFEDELKRGVHDNLFLFKNFKALVNRYGKTNKQIAAAIVKFCNDEVYIGEIDGKLVAGIDPVRGNPEFYAYYADYDWVVFCWLFGKMMDLPTGFPMFCNDLKQILDDKARSFLGTDLVRFDVKMDTEVTVSHNIEDYIGAIKNKQSYPKQENEHLAIDDARWNKKLYDFLNSF